MAGGGNKFPSEDRIDAALRGPFAEVLRVIALQPYRSTSSKHLVDYEQAIPIPRT